MVLKTLESEWRSILCALYLPGAPHGVHLDRRRWPGVLGCLRALALNRASAAAGLHSKGCFAESAAISVSGILEWAEGQSARSGTCLDGDYPRRWLDELGEAAPPVCWRVGRDAPCAPCLAIVGSRDVEPIVHRFCADVARAGVALGYRVVSGGAMGCDRSALRAAAEAGGDTLTLAPFGIDFASEGSESGQTLYSFAPPGEPFSTARAMERNALIYASSRVSVVGQARYREGGTWHGAVGALRRGLTKVLVRRPAKSDSEDAVRAARALVALGAQYLDTASDLSDFLAEETMDFGLFRSLRAG